VPKFDIKAAKKGTRSKSPNDLVAAQIQTIQSSVFKKGLEIDINHLS